MNSNQVLEQFYNWLQENSLSSNAIALYTILLALKQKSKNELYVRKSNEFLCSILNISENTLKKARNELKNNGLIDFEITTGRKNITKYLVLLPESCNQIKVSKKVSEFDTFPDTFSDTFCESQSPGLDNTVENKDIEQKVSTKGSKKVSIKESKFDTFSDTFSESEEQENPYFSTVSNQQNNQKNETHNCLNNIVNNVVVNNVCSYTTTNKVEQPENRKEIIVELTKKYREATGSNSEDDYKYIGRLLKEYDAHLIAKACDELELVLLERKIDNPRGYLRGILKNLQSCTNGSAASSSVDTAGSQEKVELKVIDWSEDFLRRAKNDKYAQFYEWG